MCRKQDTQTRNQGFTLVELIVVLVILAILATLLVPALTGYIDRAKRQAVIIHGRSALVAAQSLNASYYAKDNPVDNPPAAEVLALAEVPGEIKQMEFHNHVLQTTEVIPFKYKEDGLVAVFGDGVWSIEEDTATPAGGGFSVDSSVTNPAVVDFFSNGWSTAADASGHEATYKTFTVTQGGTAKTYCLAWFTGESGDNNQLKEAIKAKYPGVVDIQIKNKGDAQNSSVVKNQLSDFLGVSIDGVSFTSAGAVVVTLNP